MKKTYFKPKIKTVVIGKTIEESDTEIQRAIQYLQLEDTTEIVTRLAMNKIATGTKVIF